MAILHSGTTVTPSKLEMLEVWLPHQEWADDTGSPTLIGSYRFDDPDGEVGLEALLVETPIGVLHVPLTYRDAPLEGAEAHLVGTTEHSRLGTRFVYDGVHDPVWMTALLHAMFTGGTEAIQEIEVDGEITGVREPTVRVVGSGTVDAVPHGASAAVVRQLGHSVRGDVFLNGTWATGHGVLAAAHR